jgi:hypothetical protein
MSYQEEEKLMDVKMKDEQQQPAAKTSEGLVWGQNN